MGGTDGELRGDSFDHSAALHDRERVHAAPVRRVAALYAHLATGPLDYRGDAVTPGAGQGAPDVSGGGDRLWHGRARDDVDRQHPDGHGQYDGDVEAARAMAQGADAGDAPGRDG